PPMSIRVLLVDDHSIVRAGLRALLESETDLDVVGEAGSGCAGIALARKLRPRVVVTDLLLPDMSGVVVTQRIRAELPDSQVVILTSLNDDDAAVVGAIRAGALGYVTKTSDIDLLVHVIRSAALGQVSLSPRAAARVMRALQAPTKPEQLT